MTVDAGFLDGFSTAHSNIIETRSFVLPAAFFALFADGSVSLNGTRITEDSGSESFQIDFLRLDIVTSVPEPSSLALFGLALAGLSLFRRKRS